MDGVCAEARVAGKSVAVEKNNRAQTLYRWLGLREIADYGVHWDMEWGAAAGHRTTVILVLPATLRAGCPTRNAVDAVIRAVLHARRVRISIRRHSRRYSIMAHFSFA
jgi:hypothetical protein